MLVPSNALVIDDDPVLCEISKSYLKALGVPRVEVASDGRHALAVLSIAGEPADFVLCDLNMPELDGIQLLGRLSEAGFTGRIGIVSGEDASVIETARKVAEAHGLNVAGIIKKPLRRSALERLLEAPAHCGTEKQLGHFPLPDAAMLKDAIRRNEIKPFYLPTIDVRTGAICSVEALARWQHPQAGIVEPGKFIANAEQTGMISDITDAIMGHSFADVGAWRRQGIDVGVAINLSAQALDDPALPDRLAGRVAEHGLPPQAVTLEITERVVLQSTATEMEVLARLRIKGFKLAIDDFGTGFSNIEQLRRFPYSILKVDRAFVHNARNDRFSAAGLKASVMLGRELNMSIIAEGVEDAPDWQFATDHRVDHVQGFWISKPMPGDAFVDWYRQHGGRIPQQLQAELKDANDRRVSHAEGNSENTPATPRKLAASSH